MGFWDYTAPGISTPSDAWMGELLKAQQAGEDLPPHASSQRAAKLPAPRYPSDTFPGHSAWIDGDWKLHRIEGKNGKISWELYNLKLDPAETKDLYSEETKRSESMEKELTSWLTSVTNSLNGDDY